MSERNDALLRKVGDVIADKPEQYCQHDWYTESCGTTACVAGWAVLLHDGDVPRTTSGMPDDVRIAESAQAYLGLDNYTAEEMFDPMWHPAGYRHNNSHERRAELVCDALYRLADGATIDEVTA